jgi:hypothetical protein
VTSAYWSQKVVTAAEDEDVVVVALMVPLPLPLPVQKPGMHWK